MIYKQLLLQQLTTQRYGLVRNAQGHEILIIQKHGDVRIVVLLRFSGHFHLGLY